MEIEKIVCGTQHTAIRYADHTVTAVGDNSRGQCRVTDWTHVKDIAANGYLTVGVNWDGTVRYTGAAYGDADLSGMRDWKKISEVFVSMKHVVALDSSGRVFAVGKNDKGQCDVSGWTNIRSRVLGVDGICVGYLHTVGLHEDGTVVAVGDNSRGQCAVADWRDMTQIAAGKMHTVGLRKDGTVAAVGQNRSGECEVADWRDVECIAACQQQTLGVRSDGTVLAAGEKSAAELGISGWQNVGWVFMNSYPAEDGLRVSVIGVTKAGELLTAGDNSFGQLDLPQWIRPQEDEPTVDSEPEEDSAPEAVEDVEESAAEDSADAEVEREPETPVKEEQIDAQVKRMAEINEEIMRLSAKPMTEESVRQFDALMQEFTQLKTRLGALLGRPQQPDETDTESESEQKTKEIAQLAADFTQIADRKEDNAIRDIAACGYDEEDEQPEEQVSRPVQQTAAVEESEPEAEEKTLRGIAVRGYYADDQCIQDHNFPEKQLCSIGLSVSFAPRTRAEELTLRWQISKVDRKGNDTPFSGEIKNVVSVKPGDDYCVVFWGWEKPGNWPVGHYWIDLYLGDEKESTIFWVEERDYGSPRKLKDVLLFAGGANPDEYGTRSYHSRFRRDALPRLYMEFRFPAVRKKMSACIQYRIYRREPNGSGAVCLVNSAVRVLLNVKNDCCWTSWGWDQPGNWEKGEYLLVASMKGTSERKIPFTVE